MELKRKSDLGYRASTGSNSSKQQQPQQQQQSLIQMSSSKEELDEANNPLNANQLALFFIKSTQENIITTTDIKKVYKHSTHHFYFKMKFWKNERNKTK